MAAKKTVKRITKPKPKKTTKKKPKICEVC
jgi:hypothetical protein